MVDKSDPVILRLEGGLGNQLFQLAAGYRLAAILNASLIVDQYFVPISTRHGETSYGFKNLVYCDDSRKVEVKVLDDLPHIIFSQLAKNVNVFKRYAYKRRLQHYKNSDLPIHIEYSHSSSDSKFMELKEPRVLLGNFQSWNIVQDAARLGFFKTIVLLNEPAWLQKAVQQITHERHVVLHFRLGEDSKRNIAFSQPKIVYYQKAVELILKKFPDMKFLVASDDIDKAREFIDGNFTFKFDFLRFPEIATPLEKMYLMSKSEGIVCANSTFCGWSAWSIYNSGGIVVVPVPYSDNSTLGSRNFPKSWIMLDKVGGFIHS